MKTFIVYSHECVEGHMQHVPFTRSIALTIEDALQDFCLFVKHKFPLATTLQFCMQQAIRNVQGDQYEPIGGILDVRVVDVKAGQVETRWGIEHV